MDFLSPLNTVKVSMVTPMHCSVPLLWCVGVTMETFDVLQVICAHNTPLHVVYITIGVNWAACCRLSAGVLCDVC